MKLHEAIRLGAMALPFVLAGCVQGPSPEPSPPVVQMVQPEPQAVERAIPLTLRTQGNCVRVDALNMRRGVNYWYVSADISNRCKFQRHFTKLMYRMYGPNGLILDDGYMWLIDLQPLLPGERKRVRDGLMLSIQEDAERIVFWVQGREW